MIVFADSHGRVPIEILTARDQECRVRGGMMLAHMAWAGQHLGSKGINTVWRRLPEEFRKTPPSSIGSEDWVSFAFLIEVDKAIAETFPAPSQDNVYVELGRFSAQRNFGAGLDLAKGVNVHSHFWTGGVHHSRYQDFGTCTYVPLEEQAFRMDYRDYPVMSRVYCTSAHGYFEESIRILGRHDPIVKESSCQCYGDHTCSFVVSWE